MSKPLFLYRFEDLRIRREKRPPRGETGRKQSQKTAAKLEGQDDKKACLLFTAKLEHSNGEHIELQTISTPISLSKPSLYYATQSHTVFHMITIAII